MFTYLSTKTISIAMMLVTLSMSELTAQENYYYYFDRKIPVTIDSTTFSVKTVTKKKGMWSAAELGFASSEIKSVGNLNAEFIKVTFNRSRNSTELKRHAIGSIVPAILLKNGSEPLFLTGDIVIMPKSNDEISLVLSRYSVDLIKKLNYGAYLVRCRIPERTLTIANLIHESEFVKWAAPDFFANIKVTTDPLFQSQNYLHSLNDIDINAPEAWAFTKGVSSVKVAVIDQGVEDHEDYSGRLLPGFTPGSYNTGGAPIYAKEGHGVSVAGIIGATHDNTMGIKGIAPNVSLIPVKVVGDRETYGYTTSEIASAITWAYLPNGGAADILSNSWGADQQGEYDSSIAQAVLDARTLGRGGKGCPVIFASGNSNNQFSGVTFPGNLPGVVTVGAIDSYGGIYNYSSRGVEMDLVAPSGGNGLGVVWTTDRMGVNGYEGGNYTNTFSGTSAACPQVSGVVALMLSVAPELTESQVTTILQQTARDLGTLGFDNTFGYGLVNAGEAVQAALNTTMHIAGNGFICDSEVYSVANLPLGASVSWSVAPSSGPVLALTPDSPAPNQVTVTNQKWYTVNAQLLATITNGGSTQVLSRMVQNDNATNVSAYYEQDACWAGGVPHPTQSGIASTSQSTFVNNVCEVRVTLNLPDWKTVRSVAATPTYWYYANGKLVFSLPLNSGGLPFTFQVSPLIPGQGACSTNLTFFSYGQNGTGMSFVVAPNPVEDQLNIFVNDGTSGSFERSLTTKSGEMFNKLDFQYRIKVLDIVNPKNIKSFSSKKGELNGSFNVSNLRPGPYSAIISYGKQSESINFIKK